MQHILFNLLSLKVFNEDKDKEKLKKIGDTPIRSLITFISFVFASLSFISILLNPASDNAIIFLCFALSLKAIEVLLNWHTGLKAIAKNGLLLVIILALAFYYLNNF